MRSWRPILAVPVLMTMFVVQSLAGPFVVFPKAGELPSPDGRFVVHNAEREGSARDFVGIFHSLWLLERATGTSRKLCDYVGVASVGWSSNDFLLVTQYVAKDNSRALVFSATDPENTVMLDKATMIRLVPPDLRAALRDNDRLFIEASRIDGNTLYFGVWGYGRHDRSGFRWQCEYALREDIASCRVEGTSH